jgi:hypothetical protein
VNELGDQLRDAYQAAGQTVQLGSIRPGVRRDGSRQARPRRLTTLVPLAAAAAVVVVVGSAVAAQHLIDNTTGSASHAAKPAVSVPMPPDDISTCSPTTNAADSGGPAAALTSHATQVASGVTGGIGWSLWSAHGQSGATGLEDGGLVIGGRAYGLCPGYPNPAELELADIGGRALAFGVVGYPGLAKVELYRSTAGTFDRGQLLAAPSVQVAHGVSFFIGTLPGSACSYPSLELNTTSPGVSAEHNLGFGSCTAGKLSPITASQGQWTAGG